MKRKQVDKDRDVLILYHSGSGSTKAIAELLRDEFRKNTRAELAPVSQGFNYDYLLKFKLIVFGFPTYNFEPSDSMMNFIDNMPVWGSEIKAAVFTTCAMYTGNAVRTATKRLKEKNVVSLHHLQVKGPDSYYGLNHPPKSPAYEKKTSSKIRKFENSIKASLAAPTAVAVIPRSKWYVPLNLPIKKYLAGMTGRDIKRMRLVEDRCAGCKRCIAGCHRGCWQGADSLPVFVHSNCEFCLRCVHSCPEYAIIFSDKMKNNPRFDKTFYKKLKKLAER